MAASGNQIAVNSENIGTLIIHQPGESQQSRNCIVEEHQPVSGVGGGDNNLKFYQLQEESDTLLASAQHFKAVDKLKRLNELRPDDIKTMLDLAKCHIQLDDFNSAMDIARKIKQNVLEQPRPEVRELIMEADKCEKDEKYVDGLVFLWCACWLAVEDPRRKQDAIGECLDKMSGMGEALLQDVLQREEGELYPKSMRRLGTLLYHLNEDLEAVVMAMENLDEYLHAKITARCLGNKAAGLVAQKKYLESVQQYKTCIDELHQRLGANAAKCFMLGEFLTSVGSVLLIIEPASSEGDRIIKEARTALLKAQPTSAIEEKYRDKVLTILNEVDKPKK